eukprot:2733024-Amphidinium_carterae.1
MNLQEEYERPYHEGHGVWCHLNCRRTAVDTLKSRLPMPCLSPKSRGGTQVKAAVADWHICYITAAQGIATKAVA